MIKKTAKRSKYCWTCSCFEFGFDKLFGRK